MNRIISKILIAAMTAFCSMSMCYAQNRISTEQLNLTENKQDAVNNILTVTPNEKKIQLENYIKNQTISQDCSIENSGDKTEYYDHSKDINGIDNNALYITTITLNAGTSQIIDINLNNTNDITAFQFDLTLPTGIIVNTMLNDDDEQVPDIQLTSRKKSKHQLSCTQQQDGSYRIVAISMNNQAYRDNDGPIITVNVSVSSTMPSGSYSVKLSNIHIVPVVNGTQGERIDQSDFSTSISVANASEDKDTNAEIYISTKNLVAGQENQTINIALSNSIDITAFQFDITLPQGLIVDTYLNEDDEITPNIQLTTRRKSSHSISCNCRGDGKYTIIVLSMKNQALGGNDGDVISITVNVPLTMSGNQNVTLSNIHVVPLINGLQGIRIDQSDVTYSLFVDNQGGIGIPSGTNALTIESICLCPREMGVLNILLTNEDDICSFQFNIKLPEGISIVKEYNEDDEYVESINLTNRKKSSHELSFKQTEDGDYFVIAYSLNNSTFRNNSGSIVSIKIKADSNMPEGNYGVILSNVLMITPDERKIEQSDYSGILSISSEGGIDGIIQDYGIQIHSEDKMVYIDNLNIGGTVEIYNFSGLLLYSKSYNKDRILIDCSDYANHVIIVRVIANDLKSKIVKLEI